MKLNMMIPSMLPSAVCSQSAPATSALLVAERAVSPWAHQAPVQAELGKTVLVLVDGNKGTTGFSGNAISRKRYTDGGSGVPPRGRPV
ncbi:hypothetical protein FB565_005906 [Actinoplanes lutulentus]|uniref:Uncharacterized protein n=1 Tax=Actinoplanes lutulentus TaxID=1287878 RepID=A0A327Z6M5_9ACTN|nr:hypothetical protein [Actinoplanes lutulentus]MBB2946148.1 hypothetical protein [Actinoplanes lutulentus]RAK32838.1 hypothetical protein B0I29_113133 [Actinoplanes lutulentus]